MKIFKIYEYLWLAIGLFVAGKSVWVIAAKAQLDNRDYIFFLVGLLAFTMYYFKRRSRKHFLTGENDQPGANGKHD